MKILGIVGSKRKDGNTAILVQKALNGAQVALEHFNEGSPGAERQESSQFTQLINLDDYDFAGCNGCEGCKETYQCIVKDDMQEIYPKLLEADGIIIGSPTYFYNVTSDIKAMIDRCYCWDVFDDMDRSIWLSLNEITGLKYAVVISVCEQASVEDMGFTPEAMAKPLEALGYRIVEKVNAFHLYEKGAARKQNALLQEASEAGKKLVQTLKLRQQVKSKIQKNTDGR